MKTRTIAVYGKGGIGKSTFSSNISAVFGGQGLKTLLIGCDPKSDSAINIVGRRIRPLLEVMKEKREPDASEYIVGGFNGVKCIEVGGPEPGIGCAGRGLIIGMKHLVEKGILQEHDVIIFDVPADIVCGGLAVIVKEGYADRALIVTSEDFMSLYAANNLCKGFKTLGVKVGGIVYNRSCKEGAKYVEKFSQKTGLPILGRIPDSNLIKRCDRMNKTVIEAYPDSLEGKAYGSLADNILNSGILHVPKPLTEEELRSGCE